MAATGISRPCEISPLSDVLPCRSATAGFIKIISQDDALGDDMNVRTSGAVRKMSKSSHDANRDLIPASTIGDGSTRAVLYFFAVVIFRLSFPIRSPEEQVFCLL